MKSFKVTALLLTFVGVFLIGIVIVAGILFFNEKTIVVPDDETKIQDAVDAANSGDIILVKESGGPYEENVTIDNTKNNIKLIGIGKTQPVIDGTNDLGDGITIVSTSGVLVKNFIVRNFDGDGIQLNNSDNNMIKENNANNNSSVAGASTGNGIQLVGSNNNMIKGNNANSNSTVNGASAGSGIQLVSGSNNNMIKGNNANNNSSVVGASSGNGIQIIGSNNNMIKGNNTNNNSDVSGVSSGNGIQLIGSNNNVFFNRAFGNETFDISDFATNNFKGNKCDTSFPAGICN